MAKKKKKGSRSRSTKRPRSVKAAPKTVKAVFKAQPLFVKGGMLVTLMKAVSEPAGPYSTSVIDKISVPTKDNLVAAAKELPYAAVKADNYYPLVVGVIGSKAARILGIKGL